MTGADILAEHRLARPLTQSDLKTFLAAGVPAPALSWTACGRLAMIMRERVVFDRGRFDYSRHRPECEAVAAFTVPLLGETGDSADVMAWRPTGPSALWTGALAMAGEEQVFAPRSDLGEALDVHENVVEWLRAGRNGVVILNAARAAEQLAGCVLRARSADHARRLRAALTRPPPQIVVARPAVTLVDGCAA